MPDQGPRKAARSPVLEMFTTQPDKATRKAGPAWAGGHAFNCGWCDLCVTLGMTLFKPSKPNPAPVKSAR